MRNINHEIFFQTYQAKNNDEKIKYDYIFPYISISTCTCEFIYS